MRPRIRSIKPEFFTHNTKMQTIGVGARYTAVGLISMADDRGRIHLMLPAVRGYIFPNGDISESQFKKALADLETIRFSWRYVVEPFTYLWLPAFWKHQKINRPSESPLPPHPRDPFKDRDIVEAIKEYTDALRDGVDLLSDDSLSGSLNGSVNHSLTHARTRVDAPVGAGVPDLDPVVTRLCERLGAAIRRNDERAHVAPTSARWQTDMRLLLGDRDGNSAEIERIIDWCQGHHFWRANILSPGKLRKQFTALLLQSDEGVVPITAGRGGKPSASDLLRAMNGGAAA